MKINLRNYKFAVFSVLVLSMIIPFGGISMVNATQTTGDPYHIGTVAAGTYNETAAVQRMTQLVNMHDTKLQEKQDLEKKLASSVLPSEIETIKGQINDIQTSIDQIEQEYYQIQDENVKFYAIEPTLYNKYVAAKDNFVKQIQEQYWTSQSFVQNKNAFPLVVASINHKIKAVEIDLSKDTENSPQKDQYIATITKLMPKDVPWFVSFVDYPTLNSCSSRTTACTPMIGGIEITVGTGDCTLGFEAKSGSTYGFVTAGHCGYGLALGTTVYQPSSPSSVGSTGTDKFANGSSCDCMFISNSTSRAISDAIFQSSTSTFTPTQTHGASGTAGWQVKMSGSVSGNTLGTVSNTSASVTYTNYTPSITINNMVIASYSSICGDSGSPVTDGLGTYILGVHSGHSGPSCTSSSTSYYSPSDQVTSNLGVSIVVG